MENLEDRDEKENIQEDVTIQDLLKKIEILEAEKKQSKEEFGFQRAKMKELFLQKEEELKRGLEEQNKLKEDMRILNVELDESKSQLVVAGYQLESDVEEEKRKCQEQIASYQQLVQETLEESTNSKARYESELKELKFINSKLDTEIHDLKSKSEQGITSGLGDTLAPGVVLSAVTKSLARKVVSQLGAETSNAQDNLEDSMKKVNKYAQEDAEVLRSLVVPLEDEIEALKGKLRTMDQELRKYEGTKSTDNLDVKDNNFLIDDSFHRSTNVSSPNKNIHLGDSHEIEKIQSPKLDAASFSGPISQKQKSGVCDMCQNYEDQLVRAQQREKELEQKIISLERTVERYKEDLSKESSFRKDMEVKWNEKKEEHKLQISKLKKKLEAAEGILAHLQKSYAKTYNEIKEELKKLSYEREEVHKKLLILQNENDILVGKHSLHSEELQNEIIDLPNKVEDLQEYVLNFREELIAAKVAKETIEQQLETQRFELELLRGEMKSEHEQNIQLTSKVASLKKELLKFEKGHYVSFDTKERMEELIKSKESAEEKLKTQLSITRVLEKENSELKSRLGSLQQELENSEVVQKDFVRLTQSLQVELHRIREVDKELRWQHDEDVEECTHCKQPFLSKRRKQHCLHCGRIFCTNCLKNTVTSGPNQRISHVCDVCHTLLVPDTAPYFSNEPPHTPD